MVNNDSADAEEKIIAYDKVREKERKKKKKERKTE